MAQDKTASALPFSDLVAANGFVFISGTISPGEESFEKEAEGVMKKIGAHLQSQGLTYDDVVSVLIYLKTMKNYAAINKVYANYFNGKFPSRTCIAVLDLPLNANVEISAVAKERTRAPEEQVDRLETELQLKQNDKRNSIEYYLVDVFSDKPLSGNSLTVFPFASSYSTDLMKRLTYEMRQFESVFLQKTNDTTYRARIFTMEEELGFAGHPTIGAAALMHDLVKPNEQTSSWVFSLNSKDVVVETEKTIDGFVGKMNQGKATFGKILDRSEASLFLHDLSLDVTDLDDRLPLQVVSTGLPYLLVPVKQGHAHKAKIAVNDLEKKLEAIGAKFIGVFEVESRIIRTWDNLGMVEDIATGSLAGPVGAYMVKHKFAPLNKSITLFQGESLGRPSTLEVSLRSHSDLENSEVIVVGHVVKIASGKFDYRTSQKLLDMQ